MIKVKSFVLNTFNTMHHDQLDNAINHFIEENNIEVVDVKYSASLSSDEGRLSFAHSALLIYKEL